MSARWSLSFLFGATFALVSAQARAEDVGDILEVLEENVVTGASRSAERASEAPAMSSTITAEELRRYGIRRLDEALNFLSLGMFAHDRLATAEVGARGVALARDNNNHVLVVLDGMVVNEQAGGSVFLHDIPMELVDHIEVILGPGSVLYGSQAMLGVINVVTKQPKDHPGFKVRADLGSSLPIAADGSIASPNSVSQLGRDNQFSIATAQSFRLFRQPASVLASADLVDFKGPHLAFDHQALPEFDLGPHAKPGYWGGPVSEQWFRRTAGAYARLDVANVSWMTRASMTRLAMPQMDLFENRAPAAYDDPHNINESTLILSNLSYQRQLTPLLAGMGRAYFGYSRRHNSRFVIDHDKLAPGVPLGVVDPEACPIGPLEPCRKEAFFYSRWVGVELQSTFDWFGDGMYSTLGGVDGRIRTSAYEFVSFDDQTGLSYGSDPALTRYHSGGHKQANEYALGVYVQQTARPWKFLAFNAGVRADFDTRMAESFVADAVSPRAAVIATPTDNLSIKLIYSRAFRAPSFLELNIVNGRLLPSPTGLAPETVNSVEAITSLRFLAHRLTLGAFYADWNDLIELQLVKATAPSVSRHDNVASVRNYGGSLAFEGAVFSNRLRFGLNSMITRADRVLSEQQMARNPDVGETTPLTVAPRVYGNARGSYRFGADTAVSLAAGYFGRRIADQAYYAGEPSNLTPRPEAPPNLELRAALTGSFPRYAGVGYTIGGSYAFGNAQPFVVGPNQGVPRYTMAAPIAAELAPINRLTVFAGLELALDQANRAASTEPAGNAQ